MTRNVRRALVWTGSVAAVLLVLVLAAGLAVSLVDWNRAKPWLVARLQNAIGRDVAIDGDLRVAWHVDTSKRVHPWLPRLNVSAAGVTVGNVPRGREKTLATVKRIDVDLLPWALLYHEIALGSIHAEQPVLHLERFADNRNNWTFGAAGDDRSSGWKLHLGRIAFDAGQFSFDDAVRKLHADVSITPLDEAQEFDRVVQDVEQHARRRSDGKAGKQATDDVQDGGDEPRTRTGQRFRFAWKATGKSEGRTLSGSGKIGGLLGFRDDAEPWPVSGELVTGDTHIALVGTLRNPADLAALDLRLWLAGSTLADLYPLLHVPLPQTKPFTSDGHLSGELHTRGNKFAYENFRGRIGDSDVAGSLRYDGTKQQSLLSGNIESNLLQFADLGPLVGADGAARDQDPEKTLPSAHFHFERWRDTDASVDFAAKHLVRGKELPISDIRTHIAMDGGVLTLKPLRFAIAGGKAEAQLTLDGTVSPPRGAFQAGAHRLQLKQLFPGFDLMEASVGEINGDLAFKTTGDSVAQLLGHADGELKLVVDGGSVSKAALEKAGLNLANFALAQLAGDRQVRIDCAAADFGIDDGVLHSKTVFIDTEDALIRVDGSISLADEKLDLTVHPDAKHVRLLSLRSPLRVTGTFKHPDASLDKRALLMRGGGALALAALAPPAALLPLTATSSDKTHSCAAVFARLHEGGTAKR